MNNLTKLKVSGALLATVTALGLGQSAQAAPSFAAGLSSLEIVNAENSYRALGACVDFGPAGSNTACLPPTADDPAGYAQVNVFTPNNLIQGDLFIGIANFRQVQSLVSGLPTFDTDSNPVDNFTAYFVQEVKDVFFDAGGADRVLLGSATVADPFGILSVGGADGALGTLADNEMYRLFVDDGPGATQYNSAGGLTTLQSIMTATDGVLWATAGVGLDAGTAAAPAIDADGYIYSEVELGGGLPDFTGEFFTAFNILTTGPAWNANLGATPADIIPLNDPGEANYGGAQLGDPLATGADNFLGNCVPTAFYACSHVVGNGQLEIGQVNSPWLFASEDPLFIFGTPEPGVLSLLGLGLIGMGMSSRRRKVKS